MRYLAYDPFSDAPMIGSGLYGPQGPTGAGLVEGGKKRSVMKKIRTIAKKASPVVDKALDVAMVAAPALGSPEVLPALQTAKEVKQITGLGKVGQAKKGARKAVNVAKKVAKVVDSKKVTKAVNAADKILEAVGAGQKIPGAKLRAQIMKKAASA